MQLSKCNFDYLLLVSAGGGTNLEQRLALKLLTILQFLSEGSHVASNSEVVCLISQ